MAHAPLQAGPHLQTGVTNACSRVTGRPASSAWGSDASPPAAASESSPGSLGLGLSRTLRVALGPPFVERLRDSRPPPDERCAPSWSHGGSQNPARPGGASCPPMTPDPGVAPRHPQAAWRCSQAEDMWILRRKSVMHGGPLSAWPSQPPGLGALQLLETFFAASPPESGQSLPSCGHLRNV